MQRSVSEELAPAGLADDLTGHTLGGRFELTNRRFHSGSRSQYLGRTQDGKTVMVTVFPPDVGRSGEDARAFAAQVKDLKDLQHPGIPALLEAGATDDGRRYLVHAQLEGRTLRDVIKGEAPLGPDRVSQILMKTARILSVGRASGVMHGNLKPENVLLVVTPTDLEGVALLDLGVAHLLQLRPSARTGVAGTPRYMSPEQCAGVADEPRTDIYALGVITYEMLTGKPPFSSENADVLFRSHQETPPPPLKNADPHNTASGMFEQLLFKMLAKKPDARPSPADLQEEVDILPEYLETTGDVPAVDDHKPTDPDVTLPPMAPRGNTQPFLPNIAVDRLSAVPGRSPLELGAISFESDRPSNPGMRAPGSSSSMPLLAGGGGLVLLLLLGGVWLFSSGKDPKPAVTPVAAAPSEDAPPTPPPSSDGVEVDLEGMKLTAHKAAPAARAPVGTSAPAVAAEPSRLVTLSVVSNPPGAAVFEGPVQRGTTPASLLLPRGVARSLVVKLEGYADETRSLTPADNQEITFNLKKLEEAPPPAEKVAEKAPEKVEEKPVEKVEEKPASTPPAEEKAPPAPPPVEEKVVHKEEPAPPPAAAAEAPAENP